MGPYCLPHGPRTGYRLNFQCGSSAPHWDDRPSLSLVSVGEMWPDQGGWVWGPPFGLATWWSLRGQVGLSPRPTALGGRHCSAPLLGPSQWARRPLARAVSQCHPVLAHCLVASSSSLCLSCNLCQGTPWAWLPPPPHSHHVGILFPQSPMVSWVPGYYGQGGDGGRCLAGLGSEAVPPSRGSVR